MTEDAGKTGLLSQLLVRLDCFKLVVLSLLIHQVEILAHNILQS